ncbi:hypothetical protein BDW66DRAFT_141697 [Aspergillus desertorum]
MSGGVGDNPESVQPDRSGIWKTMRTNAAASLHNNHSCQSSPFSSSNLQFVGVLLWRQSIRHSWC